MQIMMRKGQDPWSSDYGRRLMGSNPDAVYWRETTFFHTDLLYKLYCLFKKIINKQKEAGIGPLLKIMMRRAFN